MGNDIPEMAIQAFVDQVRESGYCVIPDVTPPSECETLRVHLNALGTKLRREEVYASQRVSAVKGLMSVDQSAAPYLADERMLAVVEALLGKNIRITGPAGSMLLMDSRTWHCPPANHSDQARVCVAVRYAPWWLNLEALDPESELRRQWVDEPGLSENDQARIPREAYERLPEKAKPLLRHWIRK